ncbi:unnamed protein product [Clavelina lepadiformis]|uniref:Gypsy retrotransposon integrase-like protein 1 n=1 Tax=Clavelina lepadiformis TaxID=159417 RepID=A0ABP0G1L3_CLALP
MKRRLREKVWWPGIDKDSERFCKSCYGCQLVSKPASPEPISSTELPAGPWQHLAVDLIGPLPSGDSIFVVVDYYSRYFEVDVMKSTVSEKIIASLERMFTTHGLPLSITSDNGPQFVSGEFKSYLDEQSIHHRKVTPIWPQANGEVERQNRSLLKRQKIAQAEGKDWKKEINTYLLMYRSTAHSTTGVSPAELLFKRKIRTKLPEFDLPCFDDLQFARDHDAEFKQKGKDYAGLRRSAGHSDVKPGDTVLLKQNVPRDKLSTTFHKEPFVVVEKHGNSVVVDNTGVQYKRNVTHVKKFNSDNNDAIDCDKGETPETQSSGEITSREVTKPSFNLRPRNDLKKPGRYDDFVQCVF